MSRPQQSTVVSMRTETKSKRFSLIDKEVQNLDRTLGDLEGGIKARSKTFQKEIDDVWDSSESWEAKLRTESREAVETITNLRDEYEKHLEDFTSSVLTDLKTTLDRIDQEFISPLIKRYDKTVEEIKVSFQQECPVAVDKTTGEITRAAAKIREYFLVRQQKEFIRAEKFARNNDEHVQETARLLTIEDALTTSCFSNILEETIEYEKRNSKLSIYRYDNAEKKILQVKKDLEIEENLRIDADSVLLDTIIKSQRMLQQTIEQIDLNVQEDDNSHQL